MDPLHLSIALGPLAVYFLVMGMINLSSRPFLTTGGRDLAALGVAVSGFIMAGPMELFLPEAAAMRFGPLVWLLLLALYFLLVTLLVLMVRPRLVVYNMTEGQLRGVLEDILPALDKEARWSGDSLLLPNLAVQLHLEPFPALRNVQLVTSGPRQNYHGWKQLEIALGHALRDTRVQPNPYGVTLLVLSGLMIGAMAVWMMNDQQAVAHALDQMMRW